MGTVDATAVTRIHNVEGALTLTSIGGGAGGSANTEIFIQGSQSAGRKQSNAADHGFWLTVGSQNVSGAGVHAGVWINHIHYAVLTLLRVRLGSTIGAATAGNWDGHNFPLTAYPATGGWVRSWINVARTPDATGDSGGLVKTALIGVAVVASLPAVGGNAPNLIMDASDFTTTGLLLTGTAGVWQDFITADEGTGANKYGVVTSKDGVIYCLARLTLGSASSLVFDDSGFVIVFPNQSLVASNFMGITVDLQNASTNVAWANAVVRSAGATKGDIVVTGTSGVFTIDDSTLANLRLLTLTSVCTLTGLLISDCGLINPAGGKILSSTVIGTSDASKALLWDVNSDPSGKLNNTDFVAGSTVRHAIEFGTNTPGDPTEISLPSVTFSGYGADGTDQAAIFNNSGKHLIINVAATPTVKNGAGASTTFIVPSATLTLTGLVTGSEVRIYNQATQAELSGTESSGTTFTYNFTPSGITAYIHIHHLGYEFIRIASLALDGSKSIPVQQQKDRQYENP